jgi:hypothetical protein
VKNRASALAIIAGLVAQGIAGTAMAVEEPRFRISEARDGFEIREYEPQVVAETLVRGSFDDAGTEGFRRLARYIFGANAGEQKIAMTAPVAQKALNLPGPESQGIAQSAPDEWLVTFTMPSRHALADLPPPRDRRVTLREIPGRRVAAVRFSGGWSPERFARKADELVTLLQNASLSPAGATVYARYNPPWTPWFLRRNEILIPLE